MRINTYIYMYLISLISRSIHVDSIPPGLILIHGGIMSIINDVPIE